VVVDAVAVVGAAVATTVVSTLATGGALTVPPALHAASSNALPIHAPILVPAGVMVMLPG
jgi:hypothetical protein